MTPTFFPPGRGLRSAPVWLLAFFLLLTAGARAQEDAGQARFDIPAQPLPAALDSFSHQSGYQVSADTW